ncbi:hypothetical protein BH11PLA2_BH11PLA2_19290 [soil metagenome]
MVSTFAYSPQIVTVKEVRTQTVAPVRWLWDGFLVRGMTTLMTSRWKAGKTTLISILLNRLTTGEPYLGAAVTPASVLIVSEEPLSLWQQRDAALTFGENVHFLCRPFLGRPTMEQWNELIARIDSTGVDLVVIDPLSMFLPGSIENNATGMQDSLQPLYRLTQRGVAVLLVHHPRKGGSTSELSPRGTGALTGFVDVLIDMDRPLDTAFSDRTRRLSVTSRLRGSFRRFVELSPDGRDYQVLPEPPEKEGFDAGWPILKAVLEDSDVRVTRKGILQSWPDDYDKPSPATLKRWLLRAVQDGLVDLHGTGRKNDAYSYFLKGDQPVLDDLPRLEPLKKVLFGRR